MTHILPPIAFAMALLLGTATSAQAALRVWDFGSDESQVLNSGVGDGSTDSTATGRNRLVYDADAGEIQYTITWKDLQDNLTKLHIHGPATSAENNGNHLFEIFNSPLEIMQAGLDPISDSVSGTIPVTDTVTDCDSGGMIACFLENRAYVNVHTEAWPMGEIRGNFERVADTPTIAPLWPALALGLAGAFSVRRRFAARP
jgi:hypothetical protein